MGAVYLGYDDALSRKLALKVMLPQFAAEPEARERFLREARAAAMVTGEHVVTIFDVGEQNAIPFIAMEYLLGAPLDRYLATRGELPLEQALRVCRETALGLASAHELGLVHRDVKPANLWLEAPKGRVKLLDFGLARAPTDVHLTGTGAVLGTPAYMSPEQGRGLKVDHRSDLFSLGVVLYRLATGRMPFVGDTVMAVLTSLAVDAPVPPRRHNPALPAALEGIITKLLAKDPAERFQSAAEVLAALDAVGDPGPSGPRPPVVWGPPLVVGAQTQNVWAGIDDSGSVVVPLSDDQTEVDAPAAPVAPREEAGWRKPSKWAAVLAGAGALVVLAALALWPSKAPRSVESADPTGRRVMLPELGPALTTPDKPLPTAPVVVKDHRLFLEHTNTVRDVVFTADGRTAISGGMDRVVRVWDVTTGRQTMALPQPNIIIRLRLAPDDRHLLVAAHDVAHLLDLKEGKEIFRYPHLYGCESADFSPDGTRILTSGFREWIREWDRGTGAQIRTFEGFGASVWFAQYLPDGKRAVFGGSENSVVWDLEAGKTLYRIDGIITAVSANGTRAATGSADGTVRVWATDTGKLLLRLDGHVGDAGARRFTADGKRLLTGGLQDNTVRVWDVVAGRELFRLEGHTERVDAATFSPDGKFVLSGGKDRTLRLWRLPEPIASKKP
jgi:hypothetical protein